MGALTSLMHTTQKLRHILEELDEHRRGAWSIDMSLRSAGEEHGVLTSLMHAYPTAGAYS